MAMRHHAKSVEHPAISRAQSTMRGDPGWEAAHPARRGARSAKNDEEQASERSRAKRRKVVSQALPSEAAPAKRARRVSPSGEQDEAEASEAGSEAIQVTAGVAALNQPRCLAWSRVRANRTGTSGACRPQIRGAGNSRGLSDVPPGWTADTRSDAGHPCPARPRSLQSLRSVAQARRRQRLAPKSRSWGASA